ncbi:hypothetical protein QN382_19115 [Pseudomonas sp. 10B1]|uniref:hypothetical protein n=1 Tax=unclassified Pseudomonas TaxID=196821 RepID=UPI002B22B74F|nr:MULTISPECIES: hypothetical protein [unclassified Pseudomonas]MEA9994303.1 hypothetical protein [Pseudomonas sp. AA4]MEB0088520.1 hypothetical protein [Pseudomonas sp. RTI1]MEB0126557.1 hypothetical protein [Pseudomonas sp. CCC1.2]MEB0154630.1 hypothetical protein [Pseudomonas sp. CCC4.3]MEB0221153.1 hypothetical protein [Pseudomonas sp. AB12(2023)]
MARARNIKPGLFSNELLVELPAFDRLAFIGLWCLADREGRLEDRVKRIKIELFPCDDYDVDAGLSRLSGAGFISRYQVAGYSVIEVINFQKHQSPHGSEKDSVLPDIDGYLTVYERKKSVVIAGSQRKVLVTEQENNVKEPLEPVNPSFENALIPDCGILIPDTGFTDSKDLSSADAPDGDANKVCQDEKSDQQLPGLDQLVLAASTPPENTKPTKPSPLDGFDQFYRLYPRKQKRPNAEQAWRKIAPSTELRETIIKALGKHCLRADWIKDKGQFVPLPSTWLNGRCWEDEIVTGTNQSKYTDLDKIDHTEGLVLQPDGSYRIAESAR